MTVLMSNAALGIRRRPETATVNTHGERVQADWEPVGEFYPGRTKERADGGWALGVDPALWPVRAGDLIVEQTTGRMWLVRTASLLTNNYDHRVDWVRVDALEHHEAGTEPGGAQFAGR